MALRRPPTNVAQLQPKLEAFKAWLLARGSAILAPTNDYEVIRFLGTGGVDVIYRNARGRLAYANNAQAALTAFYAGTSSWRAVPRSPRPARLTDAEKAEKVAERRRLRPLQNIAMRDGWTCGLCGGTLNAETATLEHFVPRTAGGPDHPSNMILAHRTCNSKASHLSVREKIELAIRFRAHPINDPPGEPFDPWNALDTTFGPPIGDSDVPVHATLPDDDNEPVPDAA